MSNQKCCVPGCVNSTGSGEILHKFPNPAKDRELFNTWLHSIGGEIIRYQNEFIFKYRRVCHIHFEEKYWCRNNRLSKIAVPTKNMPELSMIKFITDQQRVMRSIENITVASTSKAGPATLHDVAPQSYALSTEDVQIKSSQDLTYPESRKLEGPRIAPKKLRKRVAVTPAEEALYKKVVRLGTKLSKCRSRMKQQATKIKALKNITSNPYLLETLDNLSSTAKILTVMQFREQKKGDKGRRFTLQEKILALSIHKQSPKGYRFLRKIFILPSPHTLTKMLNNADIKPGINATIMQQIKKATEKMNVQDRICIILFDEMSLKPNVTYNERKDRVSGFVTNGEETRPEFADHAQVFMVRGLLKNYKQPISYTFSQAATKGPELAKQLKAVIRELQAAGLIVVATVCDQGTNNTQCIKLLLQESQGIFLKMGQEPKEHVILVNNHEIIPLYDPPHLIKGIRNNLISKDLKYIKNNEIKMAKWSHITRLHNENPGYKGIRLLPKLTDSHCVASKIPRMKVKYATQLFSQTVASTMGYLADKGILPTEARETADALLFFDNLFDSVNGSFDKKKKHAKPLLGAASPTSCHAKFWQESRKMIKCMTFVSKKTLKDEYVPTLRNWVWTLDGMELLLHKLRTKYNVTSVWMRHLNQDPIENFFGSIRSHGCRNTNPTPDKFESAFTTLLINSLSSAHAPGANCEIDQCYALHEVIITGKDCKNATDCVLQNIPEITITPLEEKTDVRQIGGLQYVSGYFVKSAKLKVFKGCTRCKNDLMSEYEPEYLKYREYANKKWLCSPSNSLLCCISGLQDINYSIIKENLEQNHLKELIKTIIFMFMDFNFIQCVEHKEELIDYLINISCRFFIYNYCKEINKIFTNRRECDDDNDMFKIKAKLVYNKICMKRKKIND